MDAQKVARRLAEGRVDAPRQGVGAMGEAAAMPGIEPPPWIQSRGQLTMPSPASSNFLLATAPSGATYTTASTIHPNE